MKVSTLVGARVANALVAPLGGAARLAVAAVTGATRAAGASPAGRVGLDLALASFNQLLDALPGARSSSLEQRELRQSFLAAATDSGSALALEAIDLMVAAAGAVFGDPEGVWREIEKAADRMRLLADGGDSLDVLPGDPVPRSLREQARNVADHTPRKLLLALNGGVREDSTRAAAVFRAMLEDGENLRVFATGYPRVVASVAANVGRLLATDSLKLTELDAFLAGRRFEVRRPGGAKGAGHHRAPRPTFTTGGPATDG